MPRPPLKLPPRPLPQLKPKDNNALPTLLKPDLDLSKPRTIWELLNGILKRPSLLFTKPKPERKPPTELQLWLLLKVLPTSTEQELHSDHWEDGRRTLQTPETTLSKLLRTSDHATALHHTQDSLVQPRLLRLLLELLLFQLDNKLLSVTALLVWVTSDQELRLLLMVLLTLTRRPFKFTTSRLPHSEDWLIVYLIYSQTIYSFI